MSQALSCLQLKNIYSNLELFTDTMGKRLLIEQLELPYDKVHVDLDAFGDYPGECWPLKNFFVYSLQKDPFIHIDGDVFLPGKFIPAVSKAALVLENEMKIVSTTLKGVLTEVIQNLSGKPGYLLPPSKMSSTVYSTGIFGGTDIPYIRSFAIEALELINANARLANNNFGFGLDFFKYEEIGLSDLINILFGSYLFTGSVAASRKDVMTIFDEQEFTRIDETKKIVASRDRSAVHPMYNKKNDSTCRQLEHRLRTSFPDHYYKIMLSLDEFEL